MAQTAQRVFDTLDTNHDGVLDRAEFQAHFKSTSPSLAPSVQTINSSSTNAQLQRLASLRDDLQVSHIPTATTLDLPIVWLASL